MSEEILNTIKVLCQESYCPLFDNQLGIIRDVLKQAEIERGLKTLSLLDEFNNLGI